MLIMGALRYRGHGEMRSPPMQGAHAGAGNALGRGNPRLGAWAAVLPQPMPAILASRKSRKTATRLEFRNSSG